MKSMSLQILPSADLQTAKHVVYKSYDWPANRTGQMSANLYLSQTIEVILRGTVNRKKGMTGRLRSWSLVVKERGNDRSQPG